MPRLSEITDDLRIWKHQRSFARAVHPFLPERKGVRAEHGCAIMLNVLQRAKENVSTERVC